MNAALFGWYPGPMELMIIAGIALLLFGNRLPSVMRSLGRGVTEFKEGLNAPPEEREKAETEQKA